MIAVEADTSEEWDSRTGWAELAREAVEAAVRVSDFTVLIGSGLEAEVSVRFTTDAEVQALNASYRGKDQPTNVLSFPMVDSDQLDRIARADSGAVLLGDIVLAHGVCAAEAVDKGIAVAAHASHLVVHGTLHLLGYDHEQDEEDAEAMEDAERDALAALGLPNPYPAAEVQA